MHRTYTDPVVLPYPIQREQPSSEDSKESQQEHQTDEYDLDVGLAGALQ